MGLDMTDVAALYRNRAAEIADGPKDHKPVHTVMVEFYKTLPPCVIVLGNGEHPHLRENVSIVLQAVGVLASGAAMCNAQASN